MMWQPRELEKAPHLLHLLFFAPGSNLLEDLRPGPFYTHERVYPYFFFLFFFSKFIYFWERERQSMNGGGAEREGDTESETGSRL